MAVVTRFDEGFFCWADLATTNTEIAKVFYCGLFEWQVQEVPTDGEMPYIMLLKDAVPVCAMYEMDDAEAESASSYWQSYIAVDDIDAVCERAAALGGDIIMDPMDVMEAGRMALIQDPEGAVMALWESHQASSVRILEEGAIGWNELYVDNTEAAGNFYSALFGWQRESYPIAEESMLYTEFKHQGDAVGGMLQIQEEWEGVPPHWAIYFQVDDLDEALERLENLGGTIATEIMEAEGVGDFVVVQDPMGAHFMLIELFEDA